MSARNAKVAVGVTGLLALTGSVIGWLSFGGVDARGDWAHAFEAVERVSAPGDIVFVGDAEVELPAVGAFVRGQPDEADTRGFARVLALRPPGALSPTTAEIRRFGGIEMSVWRPSPTRLVGDGADVLGAAAVAVVRGSTRLPCEVQAESAVPFACNRAGGLQPVKFRPGASELVPAPTGIIEFSGVHPTQSTQLEIVAGPAGLSFDAREGLGAGVITLAAGERLERTVQGGEGFVLAVGPGQGGIAHFAWWASGAHEGAVDPACSAAARNARAAGDKATVLHAYRRAAGGLGCPWLRTEAKPAR
jgi:hypothetical protein